MATYPDGTLLKASGPEVDRMEGGQRRWIPDPPTFNCMGLNWGAIQTISDTEWNQIPKGAPYPSRADGALLLPNIGMPYVMAGCQRHLIPDTETFNAHWYNASAVQKVSDADLTAIAEGVPIPSVRTASQHPLNCGGGSWWGEQFFNSGYMEQSYSASSTISGPVDTSHVINPAPKDVYSSARLGPSFTYTIPYLIPGRAYTVRLHFNEFYFSQPGQRIFDVALNGAIVLSAFDIIAQAGGQNKAIVKEFSATADVAGQISIQFGPARVNVAMVNGIEVIEVPPV
jgi:Malectin domain